MADLRNYLYTFLQIKDLKVFYSAFLDPKFVEAKIKEIVEADLPICRLELKKEEAISLFSKKNNDIIKAKIRSQ